MTKKDYILIANQFQNAFTIANDVEHYKMNLTAKEILMAVIKDFGLMLYQDNPKFNTEKFLKACGLKQNVEITVSKTANDFVSGKLLQ